MARTNMIAAMALMAVVLSGCTATGAPPQATPSLSSTACDAGPAQGRIGQTATADLGATLLRITGARVLRWVAPGMAVTMDFRPDRLTVAYDDKSVVTRISCG